MAAEFPRTRGFLPKVRAGLGLTLLAAAVALGVLARLAEAAPKSKNPLSGEPAAIAEGQQLFREGVCGHCHGMNARGGGRGHPLAANLQKYKRGYTAYLKTLREGYKLMPVFGGGPELDEEKLNKIGAWLESLALPEANWQDPP